MVFMYPKLHVSGSFIKFRMIAKNHLQPFLTALLRENFQDKIHYRNFDSKDLILLTKENNSSWY